MTLQVKAFATSGAKSLLEPFSITRREPGDHDVVIDIAYCGVCHSDIHQARDEWGGSHYPMVPGHEIVGHVKATGKKVVKFKVGDLAGVGCFVDSCRECENCREGLEQFCTAGMVATYNGVERDGKTPTFGGYSTSIVVDENYTLKIPNNLELAGVAPLLCAGITTYSPLMHWKVGPGKSVAIVGLGGLGHMGIKLAHALGAKVTAITTSSSKKEDAKRLGADDVILSRNEEEMKAHAGKFDFILNTVSAPHDINAYLELLRRDGTMVLVGVPDKPPLLLAQNLIFGRKQIGGSLIGGIKETQEMLGFCSKHNIVSDIEMIPVEKVNDAYERMIKGDVKYRFVIDTKSLG